MKRIVPVIAVALAVQVGERAAAQAPAGPTVVRVEARPHWNDTGVSVTAGQRLRITATGTWKDWTISTGPDGFTRTSMKLFERMRRQPQAKWFALVGCVDRTLDNCFTVGTTTEVTLPASGRLYFFANDVGFAHWNNKGHVDVVLETLPAA